MSVQQILDRKGHRVMTVSPETVVAEVADILARHKIGAVIVTDDAGAVHGILSERDIVRELAARGGNVLGEPSSALMTTRVITCRSSDHVDGVLQTMTEGRFRHMPVVDGGRLAGIVTLGDLVKFRMEVLERETHELRNYIAAT